VKTRFALLLAVALFSINWTIRDLGTLPGGSSSFAMAISNHGEIVGASTNAAGAQRAVMFEPGLVEIPTTAGFEGSVANDINDRKMVVGQSPAGAFRYTLAGGLIALGANTGAYAANTANDIAGYGTPGGIQKAVIWWGGSTPPIYIGALGTGNSSATRDIADSKSAVGWSRYSTAPYYHAFLRHDGTMLDLGTLGGTQSGADSLVVLGWPDPSYVATHVVGYAQITAGNIHAFYWNAGTMTDLGTLPGDVESRALCINASKVAVGYSKKPSGTTRAVLWNSGGIVELNALIAYDPSWNLTNANGINNLGQIVGAGLHFGKLRAFVLTP
jgi:probable HAF family extracellular repeat protein